MMESITRAEANLIQVQTRNRKESCSSNSSAYYNFQMPLHYPRYSKAEYETMPEWKLDLLLGQYGLPTTGGLEQKRKFAMGAFLWPTY